MKREIWGKSAFLFKEMLLFIHKYSKVKRLPHQSNKKNKNKKNMSIFNNPEENYWRNLVTKAILVCMTVAVIV